MVFAKTKDLHLESVSYFSIFVPKSRCFLKKRSSPKFGKYFLQLIIVAVLKFLSLLKFLISLPEKFEFCPNFGNFGNLEKQLPLLPPARYGHASTQLLSNNEKDDAIVKSLKITVTD